MRHRDLTLLKRIRRPVGYDRTTVGGIDESVPRVATGLQQPLRLLYAESSAGSGSTALCASAGAPAGRPSILG